ncbi:MAG: PAS domain S-box protein [Desulfobacteraceae bacterium]|nr:PAS domain S-box protein [Desulfobacteraceae bacterium]
MNIQCDDDQARQRRNPIKQTAAEKTGPGTELHQAILQTAMDGFVMMDLKGHLLEVNEAYCQMSGYSAAELLTMGLTDLEAVQNQTEIENNIHGITTQGGRKFETRHRRKDGSSFDIEVSVQYYSFEGGRIVSFVRDITAKKRAEEQLGKSEALYHNLVETSQDLIWQCDDKGRYIYLNAAWEEVFGYPVQEMLGRPFTDFQSPEYAKRDMREFSRLMRGDSVKLYETVHLGKDGRPIYLAFNAKFMRDDDGRITGTCGTAHDITERKRAEEQLRESESRLRTITENAPDTILQVSRNGIIEFVNRPIPGMTEEQFIGTTIFQWVPQDDHPVVAKALADAFATGQRQEYESAGPGPHGEIRYYNVRIMPVIIEGRSETAIYIAKDITDQKRTAELLNSQFKHSPDLILIINRNYKIEMINQDRLGLTARELVGMDSIAILPPEHQNFVRQSLDRCFETSEIQEFEHTMTGGRWARARAVPLPEGQTIPRLMIISTDISQRKHAEEALRQSEKKFRETLQYLDEGYYSVTLDGVLLDHNPAFSRVFGFDGSHDLRGEKTPDFLQNPPDRKQYLDLLLTHGFVKNYPVNAKRAGGEEIFVLLNAHLVKDEKNQPIRIDGVVNDITERRRVEEALKKSEENFRTLVQKIHVAILVHGPDSHIVICNPMALEMLGLTEDQILGKAEKRPAFDIYDEDGTALSVEEFPVNRVITTRQAIRDLILRVHFPYEEAKKDLWFLVNADPVFAGDAALVQVIVTFVDITARKQAEQEKANLESQLQQAQKLESVGRLAGGVAHDFNNMLGVILGYTELALDRVPPEQTLHTELMEIRRAAESSAELTRQLLAFARKQTVAPKILDLNETVEGMLKMLRRLIGEDINLAWLPGHNLGPLKIDPSQIDQILANLCVNARDALINKEAGKVTIETGAAAFDQAWCAGRPGFLPGDFLRLSVSDNGCGMDAQTRAHLFEPFFTTKEIGKGTGLGLATVYGIVGQNNGFIDVVSEPGHGSTINIYLPRAPQAVPLPKTKEGQAVARGHETILLVEDEPALMMMTMRMLQRQGYTVLAAGAPGEAIRLAHENADAIHLLMTDVVMPEMNGRDLARNLLSLYPNLKRLFMSGYTADVIAHHGVLDPGVYFLQKPFSMKDLLAKVREALDAEV